MTCKEEKTMVVDDAGSDGGGGYGGNGGEGGGGGAMKLKEVLKILVDDGIDGGAGIGGGGGGSSSSCSLNQLVTSQNHLDAVKEHIRYAECKQDQMITFLIRAVYNPTFVEQLIQYKKHGRELNGGEIGEKHKLVSTQRNECLPDTILSVNCKDQIQEELVTIESNFAESLPEAIKRSQTVDCRNQVQDEVAKI
ncbi:hypothetical protein L1049_022306 [Liquidambar formosana]|uniref:Uncharacterized protein n=1 Tax=Liquidambar formosana TaxID=63359 RepID=A0AAP0WQW3_LIQFO